MQRAPNPVNTIRQNWPIITAAIAIAVSWGTNAADIQTLKQAQIEQVRQQLVINNMKIEQAVIEERTKNMERLQQQNQEYLKKLLERIK